MKLGARIVKTGLAVVIALYIARYFEMEPIVFAAVAATLSIQPSIYRSWKYLKDVLTSNVIGASFAVVMMTTLGTDPFIVGLTVIFVIASNLKLKLQHSVSISVLTVIAIMESGVSGSPLDYSLGRFLTIMTGVGSSMLVNILFLPPKYEHKLFDTLNKWHNRSSLLLRNLTTSSLTLKAVREEKEWLKKQEKRARDLFDLHKEERKGFFQKGHYPIMRRLVLFKRMIKTIEKQMDLYDSLEIHFRHVISLSESKGQEITEFLSVLTSYQERIFLKYEGKVKHSEHHQKDVMLDEMSHKTIRDLMELYTPNNQTLWLHLFPVASAMVGLIEELDHLDRLVDSFHTFHQKRATTQA
jgi:uncharacterized membrane protein YgaE (UPF0421/DUF939 family)